MRLYYLKSNIVFSSLLITYKYLNTQNKPLETLTVRRIYRISYSNYNRRILTLVPTSQTSSNQLQRERCQRALLLSYYSKVYPASYRIYYFITYLYSKSFLPTLATYRSLITITTNTSSRLPVSLRTYLLELRTLPTPLLLYLIYLIDK